MMNKYAAIYKGEVREIEAETSYKAQQIAAKQFKAKKEYEVLVILIESNGKPHVHSTASIG